MVDTIFLAVDVEAGAEVRGILTIFPVGRDEPSLGGDLAGVGFKGGRGGPIIRI